MGIKGEVSLENFIIIFSIFSPLGLKFHNYPQIYCLASSSWTFGSVFWKVYNILAGALWSLADWEEVGEEPPQSVCSHRRDCQGLLCVGGAGQQAGPGEPGTQTSGK